MAKQRRTPGAVIAIRVDEAYYCYAQMDRYGSLVFFDFKSNEQLTDLNILLSVPILFTLAVYSDVETSGEWPKIGKLPIREEMERPPLKYIEDQLRPGVFRVYDPVTGKMSPSTREACKGLEVCAVWDKHHVEQRLSDYYAGRPNYDVEEDQAPFKDLID